MAAGEIPGSRLWADFAAIWTRWRDSHTRSGPVGNRPAEYRKRPQCRVPPPEYGVSPPAGPAVNPGADTRISGMQSLASVSLTDVQPSIDPVPEAIPGIRFDVEGDRVITAGADAHTLDSLPEALASMRELGLLSGRATIRFRYINRKRRFGLQIFAPEVGAKCSCTTQRVGMGGFRVS